MAFLNKVMLIGRLTDNPEPPRTLHSDPGSCEPPDTIPSAPAHHKPDAHRAAEATGRGQARTHTPGLPPPPQTRRLPA